MTLSIQEAVATCCLCEPNGRQIDRCMEEEEEQQQPQQQQQQLMNIDTVTDQPRRAGCFWLAVATSTLSVRPIFAPPCLFRCYYCFECTVVFFSCFFVSLIFAPPCLSPPSPSPSSDSPSESSPEEELPPPSVACVRSCSKHLFCLVRVFWVISCVMFLNIIIC